MFPYNQNDKLIFANIKNSYEAMARNDVNHPLYRRTIYDCTVKFWAIADDKASSATHILGCYKGRVLEVVRINSVMPVATGEFKGRKVFDGVEQPDSAYIGLDLHEVFDTLANFRTKYWNI
jgi:hypothetical protein